MSAHTHAPSAAIDDAIAAYALDALDVADRAAGEPVERSAGELGERAAGELVERAALEAHLASCPACREELADLRRVVSGIGVSLEGEEPPPDLRNKVMQVTKTAQARTLPFPARVPKRVVWPWLAAAAAVALIAASGWYIVTSRRASAALDARMNVINAPDVVRVDLQAQPDAPGSSARAFMSKTRGMVLIAEHLPALTAGRTYQLWVVTKQAPVSVGVFTVNADGSVTGVMPLSADATLNPVAVAVTIEPEGGVPSPTGPKVLVGMLSPQ